MVLIRIYSRKRVTHISSIFSLSFPIPKSIKNEYLQPISRLFICLKKFSVSSVAQTFTHSFFVDDYVDYSWLPAGSDWACIWWPEPLTGKWLIWSDLNRKFWTFSKLGRNDFQNFIHRLCSNHFGTIVVFGLITIWQQVIAFVLLYSLFSCFKHPSCVKR